MQHGHELRMQHGRGYGTWTWICSMEMDGQVGHEHGHAACVAADFKKCQLNLNHS